MRIEALRGQRIVAVFPHPDDETWAAGGLLRRAAGAGAVVDLITLSAGEGGFDRSGRRRGDALARARAAELETAAAILGITTTRILGMPDGGIEPHAVEARLAEIFAARRPDLAIGFADDGAYGHVDHVASARALIVAARATRIRRVLAACFPAGLFEPLRDRLVARWPKLVHPDYARARLGSGPDVVVELSAKEAEAKRRALAAHRSQTGPRGADGLFGEEVFRAIAEVEQFQVIATDG